MISSAHSVRIWRCSTFKTTFVYRSMKLMRELPSKMQTSTSLTSAKPSSDTCTSWDFAKKTGRNFSLTSFYTMCSVSLSLKRTPQSNLLASKRRPNRQSLMPLPFARLWRWVTTPAFSNCIGRLLTWLELLSTFLLTSSASSHSRNSPWLLCAPTLTLATWCGQWHSILIQTSEGSSPSTSVIFRVASTIKKPNDASIVGRVIRLCRKLLSKFVDARNEMILFDYFSMC